MLYDALAIVATYLAVPIGVWIMWHGRRLSYRCIGDVSWKARRVNYNVSFAGVLWLLVVMPGIGAYFLFGFFPQLGVSRAIPVYVLYVALTLIAILMVRSMYLIERMK